MSAYIMDDSCKGEQIDVFIIYERAMSNESFVMNSLTFHASTVID